MAFSLCIAACVSAYANGLAIGAKLDNFTLPDTNGKAETLTDLKGKNGAVIVFLSSQCPVVRGYNERINKMAADFEARGIAFIGVNANATESLETVRAHAAATYKFPVLIDSGNVLADKLGANVTPETYFLNADNVLIYHGAIDNDRGGRNVTADYLRSAVDAALSGKKVDRVEANAFGCSIRRKGDK
ncbi:MAG: redoxin domain-containing protein [Pyrinomonadaceae bacterium]